MNLHSVSRMGMNRRHILRGLMATAAVVSLPPQSIAATSGTDQWRTITAKPGDARLLDAAQSVRTKIWGYDGSVPGPLLRYRQGDTLRVRLENQLPDPTSIHWHGVAIDNRMDGVVGLTQAAVGPGEQFDYEFTLPDPGTFWYHTHNQSWEQMARGLYGVLVVDERDAPAVDQDLLFVIDDWRLRQDGQIDTGSFGNMHDWAHAGRLGNWLTVNGADRPQISVKSGERIRLRLVNTANARIFRLDLRSPAHAASMIAVDGFPLALPQELQEAIELAPGQRVDVILDMTGDPGGRVAIRETSTGKPVDCAHFVYDKTGGKKPRTNRRIAALPTWGNHAPVDIAAAREIDLHMTGGAMGMMSGAMHRGRMMPMGDLVDARKVWAFNGVAGDLDRPLAQLRRNEHILINIKNDTRWPHAMHLHGHHFQVVRRNGTPVSGTPWRDTELVRPMEQVTLGLVADNPGKWLFHCHMLEHQAGGMKTWIDVRA